MTSAPGTSVRSETFRHTDVAEVRPLDGRRDGKSAVRGPERAGHEALPAGALRVFVGGSSSDSRRLDVHAVGERFHAVVGLSDARRCERVCLDDLSTRLQIGL